MVLNPVNERLDLVNEPRDLRQRARTPSYTSFRTIHGWPSTSLTSPIDLVDEPRDLVDEFHDHPRMVFDLVDEPCDLVVEPRDLVDER